MTVYLAASAEGTLVQPSEAEIVTDCYPEARAKQGVARVFNGDHQAAPHS